MASLAFVFRCGACGQEHRTGEAQQQALLREVHGFVDLGGEPGGLYPLRYVHPPNPHQGSFRKEQELLVPGEGGGLRMRLRMALGHPRCAVCSTPVGLDRRPALRAAGGLRCRQCRTEVAPHPLLPRLGKLAPLRAILELTEAGEADGYRSGGQQESRGWWFCFEGPSWQRFQLERAAMAAVRPAPPPPSGPWAWVLASGLLGGMAAMTALAPPRGLPPSQQTELRGIGMALTPLLLWWAVALLRRVR